MNRARGPVISALFAAVYGFILISLLIGAYQFDQFLPDGIFWIPPAIFVVTVVLALISRLRLSLIFISILMPFVSPFVGGGPDMFVLITVSMFAFSTVVGLTLVVSVEERSTRMRQRKQAEQEEALKP